MEPLLFILFVLFSLVSAILERRKRRKELEKQVVRPVSTSRLDQDDAEMDDDDEWSSSPVQDPFELKESDRKTGPLHTAEAEEAAYLQQELQRRAEEEKQMRLARTTAERAAHKANQIEAQIQDIQQKHHIDELVSARIEKEQDAVLPKRRRGSKRRFTATQARRAIIYAEIFGKPKAEREEGF